MTDELDRIRELSQDAPGPSPRWVDDTRSELLAMAAEESAATEPAGAPTPGPLARLWRRVTAVRDVAPPLAWAGAAAGLAAVVVAVAVLAGRAPTSSPPVAGPTGEPTATDATGSGDEVVLAASCTGGGGAYTVAYPQGWHTNPGEATDECQHFAEQPVELQDQTGGGPASPVTVRLLPVGFDRAAEPGAGHREVARRATTVAGRDAVVVDWVSTGEAALPEGLRSHRYLVEVGEHRTLMLAAHDLGPADFTRYRQVVEAMAASVRLDR